DIEPPSSAWRPPCTAVSPNTLAARSTRREPAGKRPMRACIMASTVPDASSPLPSAAARISSSRKSPLPSAWATILPPPPGPPPRPDNLPHQPLARLLAQRNQGNDMRLAGPQIGEELVDLRPREGQHHQRAAPELLERDPAELHRERVAPVQILEHQEQGAL